MSELFMLLDGGALTSVEIDSLEASDAAATWIYGDLAAPSARRMGPVCLPADSLAGNRIASALMRSLERHWAISWIQAPTQHALLEHLVNIRHVLTADGQRYFFRFADTRCVAAMMRAMTPARVRLLIGPIHRWDYLTRCGVRNSWRGSLDESLNGWMTLRLTHPELAVLLDSSWPDQLLASTLEAEPELAHHGSIEERHAWFTQLCNLMRSKRIESYPDQLVLAGRVLESRGAILEAEAFANAVESLRPSTD